MFFSLKLQNFLNAPHTLFICALRNAKPNSGLSMPFHYGIKLEACTELSNRPIG